MQAFRELKWCGEAEKRFSGGFLKAMSRRLNGVTIFQLNFICFAEVLKEVGCYCVIYGGVFKKWDFV